MFFKLARNNTKKSMKDFSIYFLTLMLGVCLFYTFNSISSQAIVLEIPLPQVKIVMDIASIFVSVILGFLIVYANQFFIRRRKKEFGIYLLLGMKKGNISLILILETLIIGIFALIYGLMIGIFASQGLVVLSAKILDVKLSEFKFVFSQSALIKAIIYFGIIFIVVIIFNSIAISKCKLIDLLTAVKKNQKLIITNLWISVILFILSAICLIASYYFIKDSTGHLDEIFNVMNYNFRRAAILGVIGTFLFFFSLSGFLLKTVQAYKKVYLKGLNMYVLRQISSKITNTFVSMTVICLMLLVTLVTLSLGIGFVTFSSDLHKKNAPYDITIEDEITANDIINDNPNYIIEALNQDGMKLDEFVSNYQLLHVYNLNSTMDQLMKYYHYNKSSTNKGKDIEELKQNPIEFVPLTEFNNNMILQGKEPITMGSSEYAICSTYDESSWNLEKYIQNKDTLKINGKEFSIYPKLLKYGNYNTLSCIIIVPDKELEEKALLRCYLNMQFKGDSRQTSKIFIDRMNLIYTSMDRPFEAWEIKTEIGENISRIIISLLYITIYIGIIFLIACAAVLAIQLLSESSDNIERYKLLRKIGVEQKEINKSIFLHIFIYFMLPLFLAVVHFSVLLITILNNIQLSIGGMHRQIPFALDPSDGFVPSAIAIVLLYSCYMLATYIGCKSVIKSK